MLQNLLDAKHIVEEQKDSYQLVGIVFMYHLSLKLTFKGAHALKSAREILQYPICIMALFDHDHNYMYMYQNHSPFLQLSFKYH